SALVMTWLYLGKMRTARRLGSAALRALLPLENCRPLKT
ncbi:MAG: hypothetical protein HW414_122, partial [Dehalococcoidia bacterium]|nr:hypothetical protein [Dehalococcoidia bacterium]